MLSLTLNLIPLSLSYATWSGAGTVLASIIGAKWFHEKLDKQAVIGLLFLIGRCHFDELVERRGMLMKGLLCLALAIVSEVFGSTMLKLSDGFTHLWPALGVIAGIGASLCF